MPRRPITYVLLSLLMLLAACVQTPAPDANEPGATETTPETAASSSLVISQIYGGGGNSGATLTNDFIELFNRGSQAVDLTGWSVQYASSSGSSWQVTALSGTVQPGQYYLVQQAAGSGGTQPLPTPDAIGRVAMSASSGKVALVASTTALSGTCPIAEAVDLVGFGSANCYEGSGATATLNNTTAALRAQEGCQDTDDNAADFATGAPAPRNSASPTQACTASPPGPGGEGSSTLVINEIDYDQPGTDAAEFVEIKNVSDAAIGLADYSLVLVNGSSGEVYQTVALPDLELAAGGYFLICANAATVPNCDLDVSPDTNWIQNGAPDAVALVKGEMLIDALSYEGVVEGYAEGMVGAPEDPGGVAYLGLSRTPDGADTDRNDQDFALRCITPGRANGDAASACASPLPTPIHLIQGSGDESPLVGQTVTIEGVVVGDYEGPSPNLRGFYVEEETSDWDDDPETSEGIFVFNGNADLVDVGDVVSVTGSVSEFQGQTQISASDVVVLGSDAPPAPVSVTMPFGSAGELERYEGMLVTFPQTLYVTEHYQLGRFGQVTLSAGDRLYQPTNLYRPGPEAQALQRANDLNRIILDDALNDQNPDPIRLARGGQPLSAENTLRGGDTVTGLTGVLTYTWAGNRASGNAYRVRPVDDRQESVPDFEAANPRPTAAPEVGGSVRVAGMNLLNFFNTFAGCTGGVGGAPMECRGADDQLEFDRQWPKTVAAITATEADVIGVVEIENDGYGPDSALQFLVDKLNAATAPGTYAFIDVDAATGELNALGTDAIKVGLIYKPAVVTPIGRTAVLNSAPFVFGGDNESRNRPSLAQAFMENATGARFVVDVNHFKSKGSPCNTPDAGDGQGNCNAVRLNAANLLAEWLASDPTGTGDPDVLIVGDLNSYAKEDPIQALEDKGYTNVVALFGGPYAYSYVFDGEWGYLDHALAYESLVGQVTGVAEFHISADEPSVLDYNTNFKSAAQVVSLYAPDMYRVSDHDPVLVGMELDYTARETLAALRLFIGRHLGDTPHANGLLAKLEQVEQKLERGQTRAALNQLDAFDNQVRARYRSGALSAEQRDELLTLSQALREVL